MIRSRVIFFLVPVFCWKAEGDVSLGSGAGVAGLGCVLPRGPGSGESAVAHNGAISTLFCPQVLVPYCDFWFDQKEVLGITHWNLEWRGGISKRSKCTGSLHDQTRHNIPKINQKCAQPRLAWASRRFRRWRPRTTPTKSEMCSTTQLSRPRSFGK